MRRLAIVAFVAGCGAAEATSHTVDRVVPASGTSDLPVVVEGGNFYLPLRNDLDNGSLVVGQLAVSIGDYPLTGVSLRDPTRIDGVVPAGLAPARTR